MNALIDFEAGKLAELFEQGDDLSIYMFMEKMSIPIDVQGTLISEISALSHREHSNIAKVIESHGQSALLITKLPSSATKKAKHAVWPFHSVDFYQAT